MRKRRYLLSGELFHFSSAEAVADKVGAILELGDRPLFLNNSKCNSKHKLHFL